MAIEITKNVELKNYIHWFELKILARTLLNSKKEVANASSLSYLFDFSNSILEDLEKLY